MTILLLLSFIIITSSCATIFTESKRKVTFVTYPESANIFVNGQHIGQTPIQLKVKAEDRIDFKSDNYKDKAFLVDNKFNLI